MARQARDGEAVDVDSRLPDPGAAGADMEVAPLQLALSNTLDVLEPTRLAVNAYLAPYELGEGALYKVELVLEETLVNAIRHAFTDGAVHCIDLTVTVDADTVALRFEDDGIAFDPRLATEPVRPASIADASPGGLGLMLVRRAAKFIDHARSEGRNRLTIGIARA
ncbi:ATP-binding protein [Niveibacterium sp. SC-1]|uniref:ATP-binding protein n=1 Tax=Niveibacterium sp. SC-1 TaxID=3135646 RepID=UPI00311E4CA4